MKQTLAIAIATLLAWTATAQKWTNYTTKNSELTGNNILAISLDNRNNLWVGTTQGLNCYKNGNWTDYSDFNEKLKNQFVNCLLPEGNTLWIGTDDYGVIELNGNRWFEHSEETRRLNMKYIRDIAVDHAGTKWIGVTLSGFVSYDGVNWHKYTANDSELLSDFILCVVVDNRDRKWIGTNDGLCVFDGNRWISYTTKNSKIAHNIVLSIAIDKQNVKWIGTLEGLCRFDGEEWQLFHTDNSPLPGNQINDLAFDKEGHLWMATDGGVAVFDCKDRWDTFRGGDVLPKCMYQNIAIDRSGNIWFGTDEKGLYCLSDYQMADRTVAENSESTADAAPADAKAGTTTGPEADKKPKQSAETAEVEDRIKLTPNLEEGYITITMNAPEAQVTFLNSKGEKVRTVPRYINGSHINIAKMKKGTYTVRVKNKNGTRTVKFTLK